MPVHLKDDTAVRRPFQLKVQFHPRKNRAVLQYPDVLQGSLEAAGMQAAYIPSQKPAFFIHVPSDFRPFVKRGKKRFRSVFQQLPSAFFVEEGGDSFSDTVAYEEPFVFQTVRKAAGFFVIFADDVTDTLRTHIGCAGRASRKGQAVLRRKTAFLQEVQIPIESSPGRPGDGRKAVREALRRFSDP